MSEIKSALTAEEWANGRTEKGYTFNRVGVDVWFGSPNETDPLVMVQNRHAMAAICLHGQPFGFTREDVIALRAMQDRINFEALDRGIPSVKDLADRIESLLPPEHD